MTIVFAVPEFPMQVANVNGNNIIVVFIFVRTRVNNDCSIYRIAGILRGV